VIIYHVYIAVYVLKCHTCPTFP